MRILKNTLPALALCYACAVPRVQGPPLEVAPGPSAAPSAARVSPPADAAGLFHAAREAARAGASATALGLYSELLTRFPGDDLWPMARYNRALLYEAQQDFPAAVADYQAITRDAAPNVGEHTWVDAQMRQGICLVKLQRTWDAVTAFDAVLSRPELDDDDRLEALAGRGIALDEGGELDAAEVALSDVLRWVDLQRREQRFEDRGFAAEAAFRLGDIASKRFAAVTLTFPSHVLKARLQDKCELLLVAQNRYLRAMRYGDHHTVAAAGLRIGALYEGLHDAVVDLAPPEELTPAEVADYTSEVRQKVGVLLKKAIVIYEKALLAGKKTQTADVWVNRLEGALSHLRTLYLADSDSINHSLHERGLTPGTQTVQ